MRNASKFTSSDGPSAPRKQDFGEPAYSVLIVERSKSLRKALRAALAPDGYKVDETSDGQKALDLLNSRNYDIIIADLQLNGHSGMEVLAASRQGPEPPGFILTAESSTIDTAVQAMKVGASDFVSKPFEPEEIRERIQEILQKKQTSNENADSKTVSSGEYILPDIVSRSKPMQRVRGLIARVSEVDTTVLITGESGTGKELAARAIHYNSRRFDSPFIAVNCGTLPESLQESELFGYTRGSFTGADRDKIGLIEGAEGGTLFLDEVSELSGAAQVKLLRFLQEREIRRVGDTKVRYQNVRVIAATNANIKEALKNAEMRTDLYYRLNVINIHMPPLHERSGDITLLASHFVRKYTPPSRAPLPISQDAIEIIERYSWPGNVRELENVIERAVVLNHDDMIGTDDLPAEVLGIEGTIVSKAREARASLAQVEREYILAVLNDSGGNKKKTAEVLGITPSTLWRKLKEYEVDRGPIDGYPPLAASG